MPTATIPLSAIINVTNTVTAAAAPSAVYNQGLIIGPTRIVTASGLPLGIVAYASTQAMISAGYTVTSPEVTAATLVFSAIQPPQLVYLGLQDGTAVQTTTPNAAGTGYSIGDTLALVEPGAQGALFRVNTITATGGVATYSQLANAYGTGYSIATAVIATGGTGTGFALNITAVGQTALQAVQAARSANSNWCGVHVCGAARADHLAIMSFVEAASPDAFYFPTISDTDGINALPTSVEAQAFAASYNRSILTVSTTQGGLYPNNAYAGAAAMGLAMGLNTGLAGSSWSMANRKLPGITPEPISYSQYSAIIALNANVYIAVGNTSIPLYSDGSVPSGAYADQVIIGRNFASDIQVNEFNTLIANPSIAQTDSAAQTFIRSAQTVCQKYVDIGWIAPQVYNGPTLLQLKTGTSLPNGYYVQAQSYVNQLQANRAARQGQTVYVTVTLAGVVQSLTISNNVQY